MKTLKLNYITSNSDLRPALGYIQFNENGFIYASDGKVLIKSTMQDAFGTNFEALQDLWDKHKEIHVHSSEWKKIAGKDLLYCTVLMEADNKAIVHFADKKNEYTVTFLTGNFEYPFPQCEAVIPTQPIEAIERIGIDGSLFNQLTMCVKASVNTTQFKLEFRGELKGIVLSHKELENTTFLLMPFKVSEV